MQIALHVYGPLENGDVLQETFEEPIKTELITAEKEKISDNQRVVIDFDAPEQGSYAFCLDNRKAHFFPKYVQIDIRSSSSSANSEDILDFNKDILKDLKTTGDSNSIPELENTLNILQRIYKGVHHIRAQQDRDRYRLSLHAKMNEQNYMHVFYGSIFETCIFIVVALFQIFFVRRWFASRSKRPTPSAGKQFSKDW
eukprot:gene48761-59704_t